MLRARRALASVGLPPDVALESVESVNNEVWLTSDLVVRVSCPSSACGAKPSWPGSSPTPWARHPYRRLQAMLAGDSHLDRMDRVSGAPA